MDTGYVQHPDGAVTRRSGPDKNNVVWDEMYSPAYMELWRKKPMDFMPLFDNVVVQREAAKDKTEGGILLPDQAKDVPKKGRVMAVGQGRWQMGHFVPVSVRVGQTVLFQPHAGNVVKINGEEYLVMSEDEIIGIVA